jgi:hypothetical protein
MAYSMKKGGKEVGPASVYAPPHTMDGKPGTGGGGPNMSNPDQLNVSVGSFNSKRAEPPKTSGINIRGTGAATKGVMARGPMG